MKDVLYQRFLEYITGILFTLVVSIFYPTAVYSLHVEPTLFGTMMGAIYIWSLFFVLFGYVFVSTVVSSILSDKISGLLYHLASSVFFGFYAIAIVSLVALQTIDFRVYILVFACAVLQFCVTYAAFKLRSNSKG
jgi:hypothetical protein